MLNIIFDLKFYTYHGENTVFIEYTKLIGAGFEPLSLEFFAHICILIFGSILLVLIGYRLKGIIGSALMMAIGAALFLHHYGILRF